MTAFSDLLRPSFKSVAAPGIVLHKLQSCGFRCAALEASPKALSIANDYRQRLRQQHRICGQIVDQLGGSISIMAFEMLEHIEDDGSALAAWTSRKAPAILVCRSREKDSEGWQCGCHAVASAFPEYRASQRLHRPRDKAANSLAHRS